MIADTDSNCKLHLKLTDKRKIIFGTMLPHMVLLTRFFIL